MRHLALVCCLVLASTASSKSLESLFVSGTKINRNVLRLTLRGILPFPNEFVAHPRFADDNWRILSQHEVTQWSLLIYVMPNLEAAFAHQQRVPLPLTQGLYLINPQIDAEASLAKVDFATLAQSSQTSFALYEGGEWHDGEPTEEMRADRWRYLSYAELQQYLPSAANQVNFAIEDMPAIPSYGNAPFFAVPAFSLRKIIGINHTDTLQSRSGKALINLTRKLFAQGYRIVFNEELEPSIMALQNQPRNDQTVEMNRYRLPNVANSLRHAFAAGMGFTVLLRDPDDKTVAGVVGYTSGNVYRPDSVFYYNIDEAKVSFLAMLRYLGAHGINFTNAGMVTPFTASIGGFRITEQQYRDLVTQLPATPVSLPASGWQDAVSIIVPTSKLNQQHLERLVAAGKVLTPLLLLNSSSGEYPVQQSAKNNKRTASMARLLADIDSFIVYEPDLPPREESGGLPEHWRRYFDPMHRIEVVPVEGVNFMQVSTLSGFPASLIEELKQ